MLLDALSHETRYPFVINPPQLDLEPILGAALQRTGLIQLKMGRKLLGNEDQGDGVMLKVQTTDGVIEE